MKGPSGPKPPEILDKIVDLVLAHRYKPKPKDDNGKRDKKPRFPSDAESAKRIKRTGRSA